MNNIFNITFTFVIKKKIGKKLRFESMQLLVYVSYITALIYVDYSCVLFLWYLALLCPKPIFLEMVQEPQNFELVCSKDLY
jgi:hypothetical protein